MRSGEKHYTSKYWLLEKHQSMMSHFNQSGSLTDKGPPIGSPQVTVDQQIP